MKLVTCKLPDLLAAKLNAAAKRRGAAKSDLVREALEAYLASNGQSRGLTLGEIAKKYIGCLHGLPEDLATNEKHMEGFGK